MALATLSIDLEARLARLEQDMSKATRIVEKSAKQMETAFGSLGDKLKGALAGFSVGAAVVGLKHLFDATLLGIDALNDIADATGASVENISALEDIAARTGTKIETVSAALVKFNAVLIEAQKPGSDAALVLERLGLNAKDLAALDPAEALLKTAKALQQFADDGDKARVVQVLFGKTTREIAPLLKDLAEAGKLNATIMAEQAKAAEEYAHQLSQTQKNIQDLARTIALEVLPKFNALATMFRSLTKGADETGESLRFSILKIVAAMFPLQATMLSMRAAVKDLPATTVDTSNYSHEGRNRPGIGPLPTKPEKTGAARVSEAERYLETLQRQVEAGLDLTAVERVLYDLNNNRLTLSNGITKEQLLLAAEVIDSLKEEAKWQEAVNKAARETADARNKEYDAAIAAANANIQADADRLRGMLAKTPGGQFKQGQRDIDFLQRQLEAGKIDIDEYGQAVRVAFGFAEEGVTKTKSIAEELGLAFSSAFEDAIVGGKGLRDILKGIEQDITRIIIRKLVTEPAADWITGALKGAFGGGSGAGAGGFLSGIGSWFSSLFSGGFAEGGHIPPGRWGIVGERGPEPVFGGRTGATVRPYSGAITINVSVPGNTDGRTAQQVAVAAARAVAVAQRRGA